MRLALVVLLAGCDFSALSADYAPWCPDGATFCDGFERGLGAWTFDPHPTPGADVKLDETARDGQRSLIVTGTGTNQITHSFDAQTTFAVRLFVQGTAPQVLALDNGVTVQLPTTSSWTCVEVVCTSVGSTVSSTGQPDQTFPGALPAATKLTLGLFGSGALRYDDLVLAPTRVGCD